MKSVFTYFFILLINIFTLNLSFVSDALATTPKIKKIQHHFYVDALIRQIDQQNLIRFLNKLTSFPDRAAESKNGLAAATWIENELSVLVSKSHRKDITLFTVKTHAKNLNDEQVEFSQPSIILKIGQSQQPGVIIGAHFDTYPIVDKKTAEELCRTISGSYKKCIETLTANKPGADDDGSGSATIFELARLLVNSNLNFKQPIYLAWYAAEEDGLVGSRSVVNYFQKNNLPIFAAMQLDQTGFASQKDPTIWLVTNYVDSEMTAYLATLINEYVGQPVGYTRSKAPASDNYSWYEHNIPVVFPFESEMKFGKTNLFVHTSGDTIEKLSIKHMLDFTKLALAFAVEMGNPTTNYPLYQQQ